MILSVRYKNHFPVVQFQNKAHIRNPHDPADVFEIMGAAGAPQKGRRRDPKFIFIATLTAAEGGAKWAPLAP